MKVSTMKAAVLSSALLFATCTSAVASKLIQANQEPASAVQGNSVASSVERQKPLIVAQNSPAETSESNEGALPPSYVQLEPETAFKIASLFSDVPVFAIFETVEDGELNLVLSDVSEIEGKTVRIAPVWLNPNDAQEEINKQTDASTELILGAIPLSEAILIYFMGGIVEGDNVVVFQYKPDTSSVDKAIEIYNENAASDETIEFYPGIPIFQVGLTAEGKISPLEVSGQVPMFFDPIDLNTLVDDIQKSAPDEAKSAIDFETSVIRLNEFLTELVLLTKVDPEASAIVPSIDKFKVVPSQASARFIQENSVRRFTFIGPEKESDTDENAN